MKNILTLLSLGCLLAVLFIFAGTETTYAASYTASPQSTTAGDSQNWGAQFIMTVSISGTTATYKISKKIGDAFTSSGTMYLKAGTYESSGAGHDSKPVIAGVTETVTFTEDLSDFPPSTYPKLIYARYETADGLDWSWVGPITIFQEMPPANENTYKANNTETVSGDSFWGSSLFRLQASIDGADATFKVTKKDNTPFTSSGTMYLKVDSYESDGETYAQESVVKDYTSSVTFYPSLDSYSSTSYPKKFYVRYETPEGGCAWVGPITVSYINTETTSGSITSPSNTAQGNFTVSCNASDPAGIEKVSVVFVPNGTPLVLCENGTSNPCNSTSDSWSVNDVNPLDYGVTGAGQFTLGLWVRNENGDPATLVDSQTVNWSEAPPPVNTPPTGSFTTPSGLVTGLVTIQASAADADGLSKVSVVFVPDGTPLVLCDDAASNPCTGSSGSWQVAGINPADYGAAAGNIILGLHVQDDEGGNTETLAASTEFTWIPPNNQFPLSGNYSFCVGHNYEHRRYVSDAKLPTVSLKVPNTVRSGETVQVQTDKFVDTANGASAFYKFCASQGGLVYDEAQPDQVTWIAPLIPGSSQAVKLYVQIGDGLGYIDSEVKTVNVTGSLIKKVFSAIGKIFPGETLRQSVPLGDYANKLISFVVKWPGSDIDLLLTKPDGTSLDYTGDTVFGYYEGKTQEYYVVYNDQSGTWQIDLKAVDVAEEGESYEFIVYADAGSQSSGEADSDNDGIPDVWELEHFGDLSHDASTDADNDGLNDFAEYQNGTDPNNPDSDNDGMPDGWEVTYGLNPLLDDSNGDADGDGFSNLDEYLAGTDPQDASSTPIECAVTVPTDFSSIQDAVNYVAAYAFGGNVCIQPGTYTEAKLKLTDGVYLVAMSSDPAATVIDGNGKDDVITFQGVRVGGVIGFTLRNSKKNGNAAAINIAGDKQMPLIARNIITDNRHGIRLQGNVMPLLINNTVAANTGDGISAGGNSPATVRNNIVVSNKGDGITSKGKAINELARNDVYGNKSGDYVGIGAGEGGISLDPRFSDGYRLALDSPCIGTGLTLDGKAVDMGAYGNSTVALINKTEAETFADSDHDGIDDNWELLFFGNLQTADSSSDYDRDGYSDLQEYLNNRKHCLDPKGLSFDLTVANAPGGEGYAGVPAAADKSLGGILHLLLKR